MWKHFYNRLIVIWFQSYDTCTCTWLSFVDSKEELEDYDTEWEQTQRALAISSEREKRQNSRGRRKMGGYLDIWNDPESITSDNDEAAEDIPSTSQSQVIIIKL